MSGIILTPDAIVGLLHSMALSHAKGAFIPGNALSLHSMPPGERLRLARYAVLFFGLHDGQANELAACSKWDQWAASILESAGPNGFSRFTFRTSGSTGIPKPVPLSCRELTEEADSLRPFFSGIRRVISVMPVHHVFGFAFALMLPKALGVPVLHLAPLPTADFFRALTSGDLVLAFPMFWQSVLRILGSGPAVALPDGVHGVSSSAPCPPEVIEGLLNLHTTAPRSAPPLAGLIEIYGATEFGAVGIRGNCREPYTLLPHWQREPLAISPPGAEDAPGEWGITRPWQQSGPQPLPDLADWRDERHFIPLRRRDCAVQIGGINVFPARIATLLEEHPEVRQASVRLMRPEEGVRLKAFVVPKDEALLNVPIETGKKLKAWLAKRLDPAATPKAVTLGRELPRTRSGKLTDWDIA